MKDNEVLKLFIPLIAIVIIFESVMLVSNLSGKTQIGSKVAPVKVNEAGSSAQVVESQPVALDLVFGTNTKEMKVGQSYAVEVNMLGKNDYYLDGVDLYVKYDPSAFNVSGLSFEGKLPRPSYNKISTQKGVIVANYLITTPGGFKIAKDESDAMMKFNVVPKKAGNFDFEITAGNQDKESATMFIESSTSRALPFSSNKLNVQVSTK